MLYEVDSSLQEFYPAKFNFRVFEQDFIRLLIITWDLGNEPL
jgi:hypothetical protein